MSKAAAAASSAPILSRQDAIYKAQVEHYLAEIKKILKRMADDDKREARQRREWRERPSILDEVRAVLQSK